MNELQPLLTLALEHKWVAFAALVIGTLVRLSKDDTTFPVNIPPRWRVWLAIALGVASGVVQRLAQGTSWQDAVLGGLTSSALAIVGHNVFISSLKGGKEIVIPGMTKTNVAPGPGKPVSIPPPDTKPEGGVS